MAYTLTTDQLFNLEFQFDPGFKLEFQPKFGIQLGFPIPMGIDLGECTDLTMCKGVSVWGQTDRTNCIT